MGRLRWIVGIVLLASWAGAARAGPWTRDLGSIYLQASYSRLGTRALFLPQFHTVGQPPGAGNVYQFCPKPPPGQPECRYFQQFVNFYAEVGLVSRWLTLILDATLLRVNDRENLGRTEGISDWTVGLWTGLIRVPVRLSFGLTVGIPLGDPHPRAGPGADDVARATANSLPTGDGEWDVEGRLSLGHSFGGQRRWPLWHYVVAEAGYWLRTGRYNDFNGGRSRYADAFVYRAEIGTRLPWAFIDRFWWVFKVYGFESFAGDNTASQGAIGLGNGVTALTVSGQVAIRVWHGIGLFGAYERTVRGRSSTTGDFFRVGLSYQR
ncbi:MAG TPA: hypothetical protein VH877_22660 [Polyangia bacterium]|nr:hypothetical protein [Polyangia bacterium]